LIALSWEDGLNALVTEGIEAIVFRTVGDQASLWKAVLPAELLKLPDELARVDGLLDDPVFFAPFVAFFDPRIDAAAGRRRAPADDFPEWAWVLIFNGENYNFRDHRRPSPLTLAW
jgi:transposase, IS5 family